jgi:hypothetical protein
VQVTAFAIMLVGMVGVLGWLIASPDPARREQEALFKNSAPELANSIQRVLEHSEELGVKRGPASVDGPAAGEGGTDSGSGVREDPGAIREMESLSELVQAPVRDEADLFERFQRVKQHGQGGHSDVALGTLRELLSMMRALYPGSERLPELEKELESIEQDRINRMNENPKVGN